MRTTAFLLTLFLFTMTTNAQGNNTIMEYFKNIPEISAEYEILDRNSFPGVASKEEADSVIAAQNNFRQLLQQSTEEERKEIFATHINPFGREIWKTGKNEYYEKDTRGYIRKSYIGFRSKRVSGREYINPYIYRERIL
jgi:hypothetical protein